jgi:SmpA / OmlA family
VRPGVGIGRISIGMTQAQVERILGTPTLTNRRYRLGFGRSYVEHDWDYARWTVGYEGRPGRLKVVRVGTNQRTQRTPKSIGVGSRPGAIVRAYPNAQCADRYRNYRWDFVGRYVTVRAPNGRLTSFLVATPYYGQDRTHRVIEVMVTTHPRLRGERDWPCAADWRQG